MIEVKKTTNYVLTLDNGQFRQLYNLLLRADNNGQLNYDRELIPVLNEMRKLFPGTTKPKVKCKPEDLPYFVDN